MNLRLVPLLLVLSLAACAKSEAPAAAEDKADAGLREAPAATAGKGVPDVAAIKQELREVLQQLQA